MSRSARLLVALVVIGWGSVGAEEHDEKGDEPAFRKQFRERSSSDRKSPKLKKPVDDEKRGALDRVQSGKSVELPPVDVHEWSPRGTGHPGMRMEFRGSGFDASVRLRVGPGGSRAPQMIIRSRTATRIVADLPEDTPGGPALTGLDGAPLTITQTGRAPRVLDPAFRVVQFGAVFRGVGRWHQSQHPTSGIFTESRVRLRLDGFEFQGEGRGHYEESGRLSREIDIDSRRCDCLGDVCTGRASTITNEFGPVHASRPIRWRRLSNGRVELSGVGLSHVAGFQEDIVTIARLDGRTLSGSFEFLTHSGPVRFNSGCVPLLEGQSFSESGQVGVLPDEVQPTPKLVEWELARKDL